MGVKLTDLLIKKQISFQDLEGKKIAIDASNMLYQFLSSIRQSDGTPLKDSQGNITSHLVGTFNRLSNLMSKNIRLAVVFDGKMPLLKIKTQEEREYRKQIAEKKLQQAREEEDIEDMHKYSKQTTRLTKDMTEETKELLKAMGIPVVNAPAESDAQISFMAEQGDVWAIASSDRDCLVYGAPRIITNLTLSQRRKLPSGVSVKTTPELIDLKETLAHLKINQDQLLVIAILTGTDYNINGVKGIGPKTALKLVHQYKDFDVLFKEVKADFNWKEIYAVFKSMPIMKNYQLKWNSVDVEKVKEILVEKHDFSLERVEKILKNITHRKKDQSGLQKFF